MQDTHRSTGPSGPTALVCSNSSWYLHNFRRGLIQALLAQGWRVITVAPHDEHSAALQALGAEFEPLPIDSKGLNPLADGRTCWHLAGLMQRYQPQVYLPFTIKPVIWGGLAARWRKVATVATVTGLGTAFIRQNWLTKLVCNLYRPALRRASTVLFQNDEDRSLFLKHGLVTVRQTGLVAGSGVDLKRFKPTPLPNGEAPVFLLIARMLRDKGVVEYVNAAREIKARYPQARFQMLGFVGVANRTAISRDEIDGWQAEGIVDYLGSTDDVRPFIAAADCVVLPSYREGTPRTLLEAAAMTRPLIATDVTGCREVVEHEVNGYLCEARNHQSLATAIERFIQLPMAARYAMGLAGRQKIEQTFDQASVVQAYLQAIHTAVNGRGAGETVASKFPSSS
ncbi:glycosyltransferase family 4 protein [Parachitinimonas caeni]|uniref:Glycosyltransferase family 4 protein n=1 Tax=Parachitinimonas caeni TaxID=3031301 RepID=A0ABT7DS53_9NEIS|nr:glycosyltransferase family 4 protein [Parachitinimonas caeni]MDK2122897.1 glycosyltransferase family 4 protein [Parachitinimonas caeni]